MVDSIAPSTRGSLCEVATSVCILVLSDRELSLYLVDDSLPCTFVKGSETLDDAAHRVVTQTVGFDTPVHQLRSKKHKEKGWIVPIVEVKYLSLLPMDVIRTIADDAELKSLSSLSANPSIPVGIADDAIAVLRADLTTGILAYGLLPETFTLRALQRAHEAISGRTYHRMAFRKRLLDSGRLEATGQREEGGNGRPAELYRLKRETSS